MRNIKLSLSYDGTHYHGWQRQENALTVQEVMERTLSTILKEEIAVIGCSRTDAMVHAKEFVMNFHTVSSMPIDKFPIALNSLLPKDIVVVDACVVSEDFHARFCAKGKMYRYRILNRTFHNVFDRNFVCHWPNDLDIHAMREAAKYFLGTHDFCMYMATGSAVKDTIRTDTHLTVEKEGDEIIIDIIADGYLYKMVRMIVGTLLQVGMGKYQKEEYASLIEKQRKKYTAPPNGLCLMEVYYEGENA